MIKLLLLSMLIATPNTIKCPFDNGYAGFTGKIRETSGKTECQYSHVWLHYDGALMHDDKHTLWAACEVK